MTPKKNKGADLEGKRGMFFLFGIALALVAAIYVIQIEKEYTVSKAPETGAVDIIDTTMPITVQAKQEPEPQKLVKFNNNLPPEVVEPTDPILEIAKLFENSATSEDELEGIDMNDDLHTVETLEFYLIENIARPFECEGVSDKTAQKECFNKWIQQFIAKNTNYPELAKQIGLEGKVYVNFVISENGYVEEVSLAQGEYEILNKEAVRVLSTLPQMIPGTQRNHKAKMKMTVPVNFKLSDR